MFSTGVIKYITAILVIGTKSKRFNIIPIFAKKLIIAQSQLKRYYWYHFISWYKLVGRSLNQKIWRVVL